MGFLVYCNNKGCGKEQEPLLDVSDNEAYCSECGGKVNVTVFAKSQMKALGQVKRASSTAGVCYKMRAV